MLTSAAEVKSVYLPHLCLTVCRYLASLKRCSVVSPRSKVALPHSIQVIGKSPLKCLGKFVYLAQMQNIKPEPTQPSDGSCFHVIFRPQIGGTGTWPSMSEKSSI
jgi:hypothetical protein